MTPEEVVREFCAAVSKRDEGVLRPLLADDAIYQNVGMEASRGIEAVIENVAGQWAMFPEAYEFDMVNLAVSESVVLTERIDRVGVGGGVPVAPVPVMGRFESRTRRSLPGTTISTPRSSGRCCQANRSTASRHPEPRQNCSDLCSGSVAAGRHSR